jgi:hypothetical protein
MDLLKEFFPMCAGMFLMCTLFCFIMNIAISIPNAVLIALGAVPLKIAYNFFREI